METLRRTIHPQVRVLDEKKGIVEYVASDESLDSYNEVVRANGARFNRFQKNAPFVDSHNYTSIDCVVGKVLDFKVQGSRVLETCQWAIDVPSNLLAQKGFQMTAAGYLKAVSIGFLPTAYVTRFDNDSTAWREQLKELNLNEEDGVRCIYTEWEQMELSACVIGANPNAVAQIEKAYSAGILNDSDIGHFSKMSADFARAFKGGKPSSRTYSFSSAPKNNAVEEMIAALRKAPQTDTTATSPESMKKDILDDFTCLSSGTKGDFEKLERVRQNGAETELESAVRRAFASLASERSAAFGNPIVRYLDAEPQRRFLWNGIARKVGGVGISVKSPEYAAITKAASGINMQDNFGIGLLFSIPVADDIYDLLLHYGQYKTLGLRKMVGQYTKYAKVTGYPQAVFITPNNQGAVTIPADTSLAGAQVTPEANTIATLINVSIEWLQDEKVDLAEVFLSKILMGLAARIDYGCFQGNGNDDINNGMTLGLFVDPNIQPTQVAVGKTAITSLERSDFINVISAVNPAALQRMDEQPPRWWINPTLIPQLLLLKDGTAPQYLLKTPAETGGEWLLCGFPVTWAAQAPSAVAANALIAVFGNPDAYLVALQEKFEIAKSEKGLGFGSSTVQFRALGRGKSTLREPTGFSTLQLAGA